MVDLAIIYEISFANNEKMQTLGPLALSELYQLTMGSDIRKYSMRTNAN